MNHKIYKKAVALVKKDKNCSISYIQRILGIGYNSVRVIVEQMEKDNIVSSEDINAKRSVILN